MAIDIFSEISIDKNYVDLHPLVEECIRCLRDEQDRISEFETDLRTINPIIEKGIEWQMDQFDSMTDEEMREVRIIFSQSHLTKPSLTNVSIVSIYNNLILFLILSNSTPL